jgi:hypothetical protein
MDKFKELSLEEMVEIEGGGRFWEILGAIALGFLIGFVVESIDNS